MQQDAKIRVYLKLLSAKANVTKSEIEEEHKVLEKTACNSMEYFVTMLDKTRN